MALAMQEFDFAILGGGMVGSTLALALSRLEDAQGRKPRILLLESRRPQSLQHPGFDARAIALSYGSQQMLSELGLWREFIPDSAPIHSIHVSDRGHFGRVELTAREYGLPVLGRVVELHGVGQRLLQRLESTAAIRYQAPASVTDLELQDDAVVIHRADGEPVRSRLLLLADGGESFWRDKLGLTWHQESFEQSALITTILSRGAPSHRAWERFTGSGPLALLPLGDNRLSMVWSLHSDAASEALGWSDALFLAQLQQAFGYRAGRFIQTGVRHLYPLFLRQTQMTRHHRLLLLGNAAQQLHPVAGQGFNLGLRDVMTLYRQLQPVWRAGQDPGAASVLHSYASARRTDVDTTIWMTSSLARLFASSSAPLVAGRTLGLAAMNRCALLKEHLARQALGLIQ
jgi:2-octaprenyl-6-methoxyphenol hydroxylase